MANAFLKYQFEWSEWTDERLNSGQSASEKMDKKHFNDSSLEASFKCAVGLNISNLAMSTR